MRTFKLKKNFNSKHRKKTIDDDLITKSIFEGVKKPKKDQYKPTIGEQNIMDFLDKNKIVYIREKKFTGLLNPFTKKPLRFDFFIRQINTCIEFDGKQHYEMVKKFHANQRQFNYQQTKDALKNAYCKEKGINLIRVHYKDINRIDIVLSDLITQTCI